MKDIGRGFLESWNMAGRHQIKRAGSKLLSITTIIVVMMSALEIGSFAVLRLAALRHPDAGHEFKKAPIYRGKPWAETYWRENLVAAGGTEYDPYVEWRLAPYTGKTIVIENDHERRTVHTNCQISAYTIWMFGGSTLWGTGSPDWGTIASFLAAEYSKTGRPVCVRNFGELAWVSTQEVVALTLELKRAARKPDLVLFYDGVNDVLATYLNGAADVPMRFRQIKQRLFSKTNFGYVSETNTARLLQRVLTVMGNRRRASTPDTHQMTDAIVRNYLQNIGLVRDLARGSGFNYAFFWQPALFLGHKPLTNEEKEVQRNWAASAPGLAGLYRETNQSMQAHSRPDLFYITDVFDAQQDTLYFDPFHVVPEGNQMVASRIWQLLQQKQGHP